MMSSVIFPFRENCKERLVNLEVIIGKLHTQFPDWQIIVVEQDADPKVDATRFHANVEHVFLVNSGNFNKAWAVNVGAMCAIHEVIMVCDADMFMGAADLQQCVQPVAAGQFDMVRPYGKMIDLTKEDSEAFIASAKMREDVVSDGGYDRDYVGEYLCLAGGIFLARRKFFLDIGGMDERFEGWGGEDDAFSKKVMAMSDKTAVAKNTLAWHLWHPRIGAHNNPHYQENLMLLEEYSAADYETMHRMCQSHKEAMGNRSRYS